MNYITFYNEQSYSSSNVHWIPKKKLDLDLLKGNLGLLRRLFLPCKVVCQMGRVPIWIPPLHFRFCRWCNPPCNYTSSSRKCKLASSTPAKANAANANLYFIFILFSSVFYWKFKFFQPFISQWISQGYEHFDASGTKIAVEWYTK